MSGMAEPRQSSNKPDPSIKFLSQLGLATLFWAATFWATKTDWFTTGAASVTARAALVVLGIGGFLPVVFVYVKSIRMQDEFNQRIHLVALGVSFAVLSVVSYSVDLLHQAGFIPQPSSSGLWALMIVVWFVTMLITPRFYR
jgi:hypothetical protein